ncbi:hypothetical protein [Streptomyces sp. NRRL WC-3549]|uniref:hypothetical protein n=1 Tax=Streptomyces sp. NRRL WC-3549 TaxID=1463925 RepID=UPI001F408939|nr:hypothetical protein [Streptomyces sp. NRRL WC-3549]
MTASVAAVALLAGGITYAAMQYASDGTDGGDDKAGGTASEPAADRTPAGEPSGSTGHASPSAAAADPSGAVEGVIAPEYLGVWEGVDKDDDGTTVAVRRITITQGNVGADVVTTFNSFDSALCSGSGELVSFDNLMVVETRVTGSIPDEKCSSGGRWTVRATGDSTLTWTDDDGKSTVLSKGSENSTPVPAEFLGTWESVATGGSPSPDTSTLVLRQGAYGEVVAEYVYDGPSYHCEDESTLVYANSRELRLGPQINTVAEPEDRCEDGNSRLVRMKGADGLTLTWVGSTDEDDAPATYRRKG